MPEDLHDSDCGNPAHQEHDCAGKRSHQHSNNHEQDHRHSHHQGEGHRYSPDHDNQQKFLNKIAHLDSEMRKRILPPEEILDLLPLNSKSVVLDAGAGSGFLTIPAAKITHKTVYAVDLDSRMLGVVRTKAADEGLENIQALLESIDALSLPDGSVDIVLVSLILHEVPSLTTTLDELARVLKPGGWLLCVEYEKEESPVKGPPMHIRIPSSLMKEELEGAGFSVEQYLVPSESIYLITASKV